MGELRSEEELRACVHLLREAFGTVAEEFGLTEETAPTNAAFSTLDNLQTHVRNGMTLYGMSIGVSLAGCVATKRARDRETVYYIERLAVLPEMRHRGYGSQLLSFAIDRIRGSGGTAVSVGLMDNNEQLKKWYLSKGFVQHDRRRIAHLPFKVCYMTMDLQAAGARQGQAQTES